MNDEKVYLRNWCQLSFACTDTCQISRRQPSLTSELLHLSSGILNVTDCALSPDKRHQYIPRVGQLELCSTKSKQKQQQHVEPLLLLPPHLLHPGIGAALVKGAAGDEGPALRHLHRRDHRPRPVADQRQHRGPDRWVDWAGGKCSSNTHPMWVSHFWTYRLFLRYVTCSRPLCQRRSASLWSSPRSRRSSTGSSTTTSTPRSCAAASEHALMPQQTHRQHLRPQLQQWEQPGQPCQIQQQPCQLQLQQTHQQSHQDWESFCETQIDQINLRLKVCSSTQHCNMMKVLIVDAKHKVQRLISGWEMHVCGVKDGQRPSSVMHHFRLFTFVKNCFFLLLWFLRHLWEV